jgi:uncharacterized membrane protein
VAPRAWFGLIVIAAVVGMASTIIQLVERVALAENADAALLCDINGTFSCGNVLTAWQSSVFGPIPNAAIGLSVFALTLGVAGTGLLGSALSKAAWGVATFFAGFMAAFTVWFLAQTAFVIAAVCLYCLAIGTMVLLVNLSWWRIGYHLGYLSGNRFLDSAAWLVRGGTDVILWVGLGVVVAAMMVGGLAI